MPNIRRDVASFGNSWSPATEWYARAVRALAAKPIADPTGWAFQAALHGIDPSGWQRYGILPAGRLPTPAPQWDQCQHGNWYFPPWHRAYCAAFEAIIAKTIVGLGGPPNWALPYWNYLDATNPNSRRIPRVFTLATLPDGSPNPLRIMPYGAPGRPWPRQFDVLAPHPPGIPTDINLAAMGLNRYTSAPGVQGFGGAPTAAGALERNPHNLVHIMIGGVTGNTGFMSDPDYAALDPIFWLHHCNIDRLWAAWMTVPSNIRETGAAWSNGPAVPPFTLPDPNGVFRSFKPSQTLPGGPLAPAYDNLYRGTGIRPPAVRSAAVPAGLDDDEPAAVAAAAPEAAPSAAPAASLVGANVANTTVQPGQSVAAGLGLDSANVIAGLADGPPRYYLNVENVTGETPSGLLTVHIGVKGQAKDAPGSADEFVDSLPLFGLKKASDPDGKHGGNGLSMVLDITDAVASLQRNANAQLEDLEVTLTQPSTGEDGAAPISVGRVSVYTAAAEDPGDGSQ